MTQQTRSRSSIFLVELIITIFFFAMAGVVCLRLFIGAHELSRRAEELTQSTRLSQNAAECFTAAKGNASKFDAYLRKSFLGQAESWDADAVGSQNVDLEATEDADTDTDTDLYVAEELDFNMINTAGAADAADAAGVAGAADDAGAADAADAAGVADAVNASEVAGNITRHAIFLDDDWSVISLTGDDAQAEYFFQAQNSTKAENSANTEISVQANDQMPAEKYIQATEDLAMDTAYVMLLLQEKEAEDMALLHIRIYATDRRLIRSLDVRQYLFR